MLGVGCGLFDCALSRERAARSNDEVTDRYLMAYNFSVRDEMLCGAAVKIPLCPSDISPASGGNPAPIHLDSGFRRHDAGLGAGPTVFYANTDRRSGAR